MEAYGISSDNLAAYLLEKEGVAAISGTAFGDRGEGFLRFSYANSTSQIKEALERIARALGNLKQGGYPG